MRPKHLALEPWQKRNDRKTTTRRWEMMDIIILGLVIAEAERLY